MKIGRTISTFLAVAALAIPSFAAAAEEKNAKLEQQVRQAILTLPWYGVFDGIDWEVGANGIVTLKGQVRTYNVHNSAVDAVKRIAGVVRVNDRIEVLPLSPFDDIIRVRAYNAGGLSPNSNEASVTIPVQPVYLSDLAWVSATNGYGPVDPASPPDPRGRRLSLPLPPGGGVLWLQLRLSFN